MLVNGWTVEAVDGRICCMACGSTAGMDSSRDCVCDACREELGSEFLTDGVAYAVWACVDSLLQGFSWGWVAGEAGALLPAGSQVRAADVTRMARLVVGGES